MFDIQNLTLRQIRELKNLFLQKENEEICSDWFGKYVIVRTYSAGVHFGILNKKIGDEVILNKSRRIWYWEGSFTLSKIAVDGLSKSSKISIEVPEIKLTEIEIIPCSETCIKIINEIKEYIP